MYGSGSMSDIMWFVRLPRLVLAIGVGMALALAGVVMQAIVKNPLADPYVLGVSSGASWATLAILVGWAPSWAAAMWAWWPSPGRSWSPWGDRPGQHRRQGHLGKADSGRHGPLRHLCRCLKLFPVRHQYQQRRVEAVVRWTMGSLAAASWDTNLWMLAVAVLGALFSGPSTAP